METPVINDFWHSAIPLGRESRTLYSGPSWNPTAVTLYSIDLHLQYPEVKADLAQRAQQGQLSSEVEVCQALAAGAYTKAFTLKVGRLVTGVQFGDEIARALRPQMQGEEGPLEAFQSFFHEKFLEDGCTLVLLWRCPDTLELFLCPPGAHPEDFPQAHARIQSARLSHSLRALYLDPSSPTPEARKKWIENAKALLSL